MSDDTEIKLKLPKATFKEKPRKPIIYWVDTILLIALIVMVVIFKYQGAYIDKEVHVIEVCTGTPTGNTEILKDIEASQIIANADNPQVGQLQRTLTEGIK